MSKRTRESQIGGAGFREIKPVTIGSLHDFFPRLRTQLTEIDYTNPLVVVRRFGKDRTAAVLRRGTDRDGNSIVWNWAHDARHDPSNLPDPGSILYGRLVDLSQDPPVEVSNIPQSRFFPLDDLTATIIPDPQDRFIAVYNADRLERTARNEFRFTVSPRDALLAVFMIAKI